MDDARKAVARLLNQKYLGFLEWILHEITEFIELACGPNLKGEVSAQKKQWIANLIDDEKRANRPKAGTDLIRYCTNCGWVHSRTRRISTVVESLRSGHSRRTNSRTHACGLRLERERELF